jgi:transposase
VVLSPLSRHSKKTAYYHVDKSELGGDIFMAKKGQVFQQYSDEFKVESVKAYVEGSESYKIVANRLEIRSCTELKEPATTNGVQPDLSVLKDKREIMKSRNT